MQTYHLNIFSLFPQVITIIALIVKVHHEQFRSFLIDSKTPDKMWYLMCKSRGGTGSP